MTLYTQRIFVIFVLIAHCQGLVMDTYVDCTNRERIASFWVPSNCAKRSSTDLSCDNLPEQTFGYSIDCNGLYEPLDGYTSFTIYSESTCFEVFGAVQIRSDLLESGAVHVQNPGGAVELFTVQLRCNQTTGFEFKLCSGSNCYIGTAYANECVTRGDKSFKQDVCKVSAPLSPFAGPLSESPVSTPRALSSPVSNPPLSFVPSTVVPTSLITSGTSAVDLTLALIFVTGLMSV